MVAVDALAEAADVHGHHQQRQPGRPSCQYLVDKRGGKGNVIIENGPQISAVIDRVNGCESVLAKYPAIKILSSGLDCKGSRDVGFSVAQSLLTRSTTWTHSSPSTTRRRSHRPGRQADGPHRIAITGIDGARTSRTR